MYKDEGPSLSCCLLTDVLTDLFTCLLACLLAHSLTHLLPYLLTYLLTYEHALQELGDDPSLTVKTSMAITFSFLYLFVASGLLGAAFGLTAALLLKASPSIHVHQVGCCCYAALHS